MADYRPAGMRTGAGGPVLSVLAAKLSVRPVAGRRPHAGVSWMQPLDRSTAFLLTLPPLFWAGNAVLARMLVGDMPPLALSLIRWSLALALFLPFVWRGLIAAWPALRAAWRDVLWISLTGVAAYNSLQYVAVQTSSAVNVTLIAAATPVFALVLGVLLFGERARGAQWLGAGLSIAGVVWVMLRGDLANVARLNFVAGDLVMIGANTTWAVYTWLLRKRRPQVPFGPFLAAQMLVGALMIAPMTVLEAARSHATIAWTPTTLAVVLYVALFPSLLAYYCWDRGVARVGAMLPVHFANLTPIFAALLSTLLLGEAPRLYHLIGLVAIVAGIHVANRR